jgi:hypothetical protein
MPMLYEHALEMWSCTGKLLQHRANAYGMLFDDEIAAPRLSTDPENSRFDLGVAEQVKRRAELE